MADFLAHLAPYVSVSLLFGGAIAAVRSQDKVAPLLAERATLGALIAALIGAGGVAFGSGAASPLALLRLDPLAAMMLTLIAGVGLAVVRYSKNYLGGDPRRAEFLSGLCITLGAVATMVTAGNLIILAIAWVTMSLSLHRMLLFYGERKAAQVAARKKFILARIGDACLIGAVGVLIGVYETTSVDAVLAAARNGVGAEGVGVATILLAIAAMLKSAQFPSHGWLTEVMETPTPVSALLHAGVVNAGGFLLIRFADVMVLNMPMLGVVAIIGGFTALFGGFAMLTQTSVKVSLAYSTVAQMGFMILQCGLGAFSAAALHLVAHSLYKAHAFLASGRAVTAVAARETKSERAPAKAIAGIAIALGIYALCTVVFGSALVKTPAIIGLGAIFVAGLSIYISDLVGDRDTLVRGGLVALGASGAYFALQAAMLAILAPVVPVEVALGTAGTVIFIAAVVSFVLAAFAQAAGGDQGLFQKSLYVHLSRGLYANAVFNRLIGALSTGSNVRS
ncbi:MAG: proton-conducting transporter membrane subunit [Pseudomonadota bacterium]